jgi:hypothetical protein
MEDVAESVSRMPASVNDALPGCDERERYPLLGHIDRYGNTCFNGLQSQTLLEELERRQAEEPSGDQQALLQALRVLVAAKTNKPHQYLCSSATERA